MSREVFEYFFDPEDLEPYYSQLPQVVLRRPRDPIENSEASLNGTANRESQTIVPRDTSIPNDEETSSEIVPNPTAQMPNPGGQLNPSSAMARTAIENVSETQSGKPSISRQLPHRVRQFLSVHALGQYSYCVRSAILASEIGDDQDVDEPMPRLTYIPNFDRERIEEVLSDRLRNIGVSLLYFLSMLILMAIGVLSQNRLLFYPVLFAFAGYLVWFVMQLSTIVQLSARRRAAINAEANEPAPDFYGVQPANWWSMLKAGFEPVNYQRPFRHPEQPLEGCPWRVLERGDFRIPVIRSGSKKLGPAPGKLFEKHQIRLAAYAMLLENTEHVQSPYGLVFPSNSPMGFALEVTDDLRSKAVKMLRELQLKLRESQMEKIEPRLPEKRSRCENCRYGKPEQIEVAELESQRKAGAQLVVLRSQSERLFHCSCADRFGSAPPHRDVTRLQLHAIIE